jgi:hypothetical protein
MIHRFLSGFGRVVKGAFRTPLTRQPRQILQTKVLQTKWAVPTDVQACMNDTALVLLHIRKGMVYRADHVGAQLWRSIAEGVDLRGLIAQIAHTEGVDPHVVERDAETFVTDLARRELIRPVELL